LLGLTSEQGSIKTKIEVDFLENGSKYKTEVLKNAQKKLNRSNFSLNRFGREKT